MDFGSIDNAWECIVAVAGILGLCFIVWVLVR